MGSLFLNISIIFFMLASIAYLNRKKIFGKAGEFWTKKELKKLSNEYKVINDVMIKTNDGRTHQIDHIIVSKYGIFVIETKHLNASITGKEKNIKWEYKTFYGWKRYMYNPLRQNYGHVQALKEILNIEEDKFISIVCITSNAKVDVDSDKVVFVNNLLEKIKSYNINKIYNEQEIYNKIQASNITGKRKRHVKNIKKVNKQKEIENRNKCPLCGAYLTGRNGKYGPFTGCSNYPNCQFTKK